MEARGKIIIHDSHTTPAPIKAILPENRPVDVGWFVLGKGSHARITVDGKTTIIKAGELTPAYVGLLLKQLEVPREAVN